MEHDATPSTQRYIAFEGVEGAGKSTVADRVAAHLEVQGHAVVRVREPGGTDVGEHIREILLDGEHTPVPRAEAALFAAARAHLVAEKVIPALAAGSWVISDRSAYSSLAYQAAGRGLALDDIRHLNDIAIGGVWPGVVVLLRTDPAIGLSRQEVGDRIGNESDDFHRTVADAFDALADEEPDRFLVIDASRSLERVVVDVLDALGVTT
ncbi:MAG: dTMP kinase [Actinomycetia bacterium]|nr:dTMP kinase [Actinomycetes bacterium]